MGTMNKQVPVECYSRVVGFYRPLSQWNPGKKEEYRERVNYIITGEHYDNGKGHGRDK